ncbi:ribosome biogenesis protein bop1 [Plakobranchus ocellatus]|uniref:Ribosome biogenesis protein bop1 n=1 Tax=Plakobranchus ocellatus TaxID=259542 RepID=A0AAV4CLX9_9GAST|nr:ribosome biogenesis protein bop1 [Plakobranchus ocellatus]
MRITFRSTLLADHRQLEAIKLKSCKPEITKRYRMHIPAPKEPLPGHAESFNPPQEYLFDEEEETKWNDQEPEDRRMNFKPQKFHTYRAVPKYEKFINERFHRLLDLYLASRQRKMKMNVNPEDLIPKRPDKRDLQPYPTREGMIYKGHKDMVRTISPDPSGQWLASGSDDFTVKIWEIATGRCMKTISLTGKILYVAWNPNPSINLLAASVGSYVMLINPSIGDKLLCSNTDSMLDGFAEEGSVSENKSPVNWSTFDGSDRDKGLRLKVAHEQEIAHFTWHAKGDYFATVQKGSKSQAVLIHQLSKRQTQAPFSKPKGLVQRVMFHPIHPYFFVAELYIGDPDAHNVCVSIKTIATPQDRLLSIANSRSSSIHHYITMAVDSVALKLPTFWVSSPLAWFAQAEAQFELRKITQDDTRYYNVVASLDTNTAKRALPIITAPPPTEKYKAAKDFLTSVASLDTNTAKRALPIITAPPPTEKYKAAKDFLTSAYGLSDEERATALLSMNGLGDNKPSELMDNMLSLLGQHQPCFLFKQIFLQQLPDHVRTPLSVSAISDYRTLAREADKLFLAGGLDKYPKLAQCGNPEPQLDAVCWYHHKYGDKAKKCMPSCPRHFGQRGQVLQAANGTTISTFGSRDVKLRFHGTTYEARLIIADVKRPLLGADFFRRHNFLVDLNGQRLIEADSYLSSPCSTSRVTKTELAPIERDCNKFRKVLQEFPALLQPTFSSESVKTWRSTLHCHIRSTGSFPSLSVSP